MIGQHMRSRLLFSTARSYCQASNQGTGSSSQYQQGKVVGQHREYFYFIDHQGQLFLDDTKIKNFVTCFKDKVFLKFFFRRLRANDTGRYDGAFPFYSPCGPEINFVHCDDLPVVFSQLTDSGGKAADLACHLNAASTPAAGEHKLWYGGDNHQILSVNFSPSSLFMLPGTGRVYHAAPDKLGGIGLVKSALAIELSKQFVYAESADPDSDFPTGFNLHGTVHALENKFAKHFSHDES